MSLQSEFFDQLLTYKPAIYIKFVLWADMFVFQHKQTHLPNEKFSTKVRQDCWFP